MGREVGEARECKLGRRKKQGNGAGNGAGNEPGNGLKQGSNGARERGIQLLRERRQRKASRKGWNINMPWSSRIF